MRKNYTLTITLLFIFTSLSAQNFVNAIVWEANTKSGGKFIGISNDQYEAEIIIDELKFENEGTKYEVDMVNINKTSIALKNENLTVYDDFISDSPDIEYKYISEIELIALQYMEDNSYETGIKFYMNVSRVKSEAKAKHYLETLYTNYSKYLFNIQTPAMLVSYSE
ncbi:hypothetical protein [Aquimarina agarivorans]|uniref:hypothetical protein n=1 Tax=Aquimarina agarivorans TaxID=980584 RepID=UPI000248EC29|nr:hypothetical protein [Aquimarina agarivorans]